MMVRDNGGQVALEYLLIFAVSLILLIVFTMPMVQLAIADTLDVSDTLNAKSDMSKIAQAVEEVYGQGQGSKQTVHIVSSKNLKMDVASGSISCSLKLKDGTSKVERIYFTSTLKKSGLILGKGENSIVVEWPQSAENMQIYVS